MTKKITLAALMLTLLSGLAFAQNAFKLSAGFGITGIGNWETTNSKYKNEQSGYWTWTGSTSNNPVKFKEETWTEGKFDLGGFLFFDATYVELDVSLGAGKLPYYSTYDALKLGLALFGKYPIKAGSLGLTIAPMLGVQYDMTLSAKDYLGNAVKNGDNAAGTGVRIPDPPGPFEEGSVLDFSTLSIKIGAEAKFPISAKLYLSTQALWGIRLNNKYIDALKKAYDYWYDNDSSWTDANKIDFFTHGVTFKVGLGWML